MAKQKTPQSIYKANAKVIREQRDSRNMLITTFNRAKKTNQKYNGLRVELVKTLQDVTRIAGEIRNPCGTITPVNDPRMQKELYKHFQELWCSAGMVLRELMKVKAPVGAPKKSLFNAEQDKSFLWFIMNVWFRETGDTSFKILRTELITETASKKNPSDGFGTFLALCLDGTNPTMSMSTAAKIISGFKDKEKRQTRQKSRNK